MAGGAIRRRSDAPCNSRRSCAPSPAALAAADQLLNDIGVKESIAMIVPTMMTEFERNITTTSPEIRGSLRETLTAIKPEFDKTAHADLREGRGAARARHVRERA